MKSKCEEDDLEFYTMKEIEWSLQGYRGQSKSFRILERWFLTMMQTQINADCVRQTADLKNDISFKTF